MQKILVILMIIWLPFEALLNKLKNKIKLPTSETRLKWNKKFYDIPEHDEHLNRVDVTDNWFLFIFGILFIIGILFGGLMLFKAVFTGAIWAIIPG